MDDIPLSTFILLFALILLSAFFSSAETAFSSVNKIRLKNFMDNGVRGSKKAYAIVENFDKALSTILVGNNVVTIAAASISASLAAEIWGASTGIVLSTFFMTILILIFCEILPKSIVKQHAEKFLITISGIMYYLIKLFFPINFLIIQLKGFISRVFIKDKHLPSITEEDIKTLINISEEEGVIDKEEKELIHRSMDFDDILVGEALTPRIDMVAIEVNQSIEEIKQVFFNQRYSRIPVYEDTIDNIIGILSEKEFLIRLLKYETVNIRELLREPIFVVESVKISSLLPKLQKSKLHMAIVLDEFGGTAGLITLEDILEEIVGEIWDEQDETRNSMIKINETTYKFDAQCQLNEFAELMEVNLPESSYHTLGGWVIERFQEIPAIGSMFAYENLKITVEKVEQRRIRSIIVEKMPPQLFIEQNNMTIMQEVH